jgi:hypothetical protein
VEFTRKIAKIVLSVAHIVLRFVNRMIQRKVKRDLCQDVMTSLCLPTRHTSVVDVVNKALRSECFETNWGGNEITGHCSRNPEMVLTAKMKLRGCIQKFPY